jgi:hypothetical protein
MSFNHLENATVWVVSIHDMAPQGYLSFDVKDILHCLGPGIHDYSWVITELDCTGKEAQPLCDAVERSRGQGLMISADELLPASHKFFQTIDATLIGVPKKVYNSQELKGTCDIGSFPEAPAQVVIRAVDSSYFEVITKNYNHVQLVKKCFQDVRDEDIQEYFSTPGNR